MTWDVEHDRQDPRGQDAGTTLDDRTVAQAVAIMTTEHYNLQSIRAATISDSSSRASLFLGTVSSTLVALAFVGQVSKSTDPRQPDLGEPFYVFSLVLFPSLLFLGLVTFDRVLQSAIEDDAAARGINRIRHYYVEIAPQLAPYFMQSTHDDDAGTAQNMGLVSVWWQIFLDRAGMIAVINSVIAGVSASLIVSRLVVTKPLALYVLIGAVAFLVSLALHQLYQAVWWHRTNARLPVMFPSPKGYQEVKPRRR